MRALFVFVLIALLFASLLYLAIDWQKLGIICGRLAEIDASWMLFAISVLLLQLLRASRWRRILMQGEISLMRLKTYQFILNGAFFNRILPSMSGDAVTAWYVVRNGAGWANAIYSVLIDQVVGMLALGLIVAGCLLWAFGLITEPPKRLALLAIAFGTILDAADFDRRLGAARES